MNGWSNSETWRAFTEISNTEWKYLAAVEIVKKNKHLAGMILGERFFYGKNVNWHEIAEAFADNSKS